MLYFLILTILSIAASILAAFLMLRHLKSGRIYLAIGALLGPVILILQYGIFSIAPAAEAVFLDRNVWGISTFSYLLAFVIMMTGAGAYYLGFMGSVSTRLSNETPVQSTGSQRNMLWGLFLAAVMLDLYARIIKFQSGTYFTWMRARVLEEGADIGAIAMLGSDLFLIIIVLCVYFSKASTLARVYLFVIFLLVFLEGSRTNIILAFAALYLSLWQNELISKRVLRLEFIVVLPVIYLAVEVILQTRIIFRADVRAFIESPEAFFLEAFPRAIMIILGFEERSLFSQVSVAGASLGERSSAWATSFAFQIQQLFRGYDLLSFNSALRELSRSVPSVLWPGEKPLVLSGLNLVDHFDMPIVSDPATTSFSSAFLHFGFLGLPIFGFIVGRVNRLILVWTVTMYGQSGYTLFLGLMYLSVFDANSFSGYFTDIRNLVLVLCVGLVVGFLVNSLKRVVIGGNKSA